MERNNDHGPESLGKVMERVQAIPLAKPSSDTRQSDAERQAAMQWATLARVIGPRYAACRFANFEAASKAQQRVVDRLRRYIENLDENVKAGRNVVLIGLPGTGKDHLLAAMMRQACRSGRTVAWVDGMGLFAQRRDAIDSTMTEKSIIYEYTTAHVLAISDPVPPFGDLTQGQAEFLFRIIDRRYRAMKPTWVSANFQDGEDAKKRIGAQVVDRLRHDALTLKCDWESHRQPAED